MLKTKSLLPHDKPVYREIIPHALKTAWKNPLFWLFGVFAAILNTGGSLDVVWKFWSSVQTQGSNMFVGDSTARLWNASQIAQNGLNWLHISQGIVVILFFLILVLAFAAASCIAQGALVYNVGGMKLLKKTSFKQILSIGAKAIIPIAILDIIVIIAVWLARFAISLPLSFVLGKNSTLMMVLYVITFIIFFVVAVGISIMQIYALNAMILQGATLVQAFKRAWEVIIEHWLVTLETAILQGLVVFAIGAVAAIIGIILTIPFMALYMLSIVNNNLLLFNLTIGCYLVIFVLYSLVLLGFVVTFQYSIWAQMFKKFGEGGVVPKLHRLVRALTNRTSVPQP
ncbi:MAG: hypothetical protein WCW31_00505 [Patescibacteria group bacterium]|jgi:hypothetical protein